MKQGIINGVHNGIIPQYNKIVTRGFTIAQLNKTVIPYTNLMLWLRADLLALGSVSLWEDKSGRGFNATQSTAINQAVNTASVINGLPAVRFDGSNDYLTLGTQLGKPASWTIYIVCSLFNAANDVGICGSCSSTAASTTTFGYIETYPANNLYYSFGDLVNSSTGYATTMALANNTFYVMKQQYTTGNKYCNFSINGVPIGSSQVLTAANNVGGTIYNFSIGRLGEYNGLYLKGDIAEVIIYDASLSYDYDLRVTNYLKSKYAL